MAGKQLSPERQRSNANLVRGQSPRPEAAARQRANLNPFNAIRSGAYSEVELAPLRDQNLADLQTRFPDAPQSAIWPHANRAARMAKLAAYIDQLGPLKGNGDLWPAADALARLEAAHERQEERLEDRYGTGQQRSPHELLAAVLAEHAAAGGEEDA